MKRRVGLERLCVRSCSSVTWNLQAETINRLLKKQSRARGKRNALSTAEDKPGPGEPTQGEGDEEEMVEALAPPPTMYRWVSSARPRPTADAEDDTPSERVMTLSFSVPVSAIPQKLAEEAIAMEVDNGTNIATSSRRPNCDVQGCTSLRKYRLVRDFRKGACGMSHLKLLEGQLV